MPIDDIIKATKCSLSIEWNDYRTVYEQPEEFYGRVDPEWVDKDRCFADDSFWEGRWHKRTAVGFYHVVAPTLDLLIAALEEFV